MMTAVFLTLLSILSVTVFTVNMNRSFDVGAKLGKKNDDAYVLSFADLAVRKELIATMKAQNITSYQLNEALVCASEAAGTASGGRCSLGVTFNSADNSKWAFARKWTEYKKIDLHALSQESNLAVKENTYFRLLNVEMFDESSFLNVGIATKMPDGTYKELERLRLRGGTHGFLSNAVTVNSLKCTLCHAKIYGDVVEYEANSLGDSRQTMVHGGWYKPTNSLGTPGIDSALPQVLGWAQNVLGLPLNGYPHQNRFAANYVFSNYDLNSFTPIRNEKSVADRRNHEIFVRQNIGNYASGSKMPFNSMRQELVLPKFDPFSYSAIANGTLRAMMCTKALHSSDPIDSACAKSRRQIQGKVSGNFLLDGTNQPIEITGNIFVEGDLIIFGVVRGQGNIGVTGNIYIADDLGYRNPLPANGSIASHIPLFSGSTAGNQELTLIGSNPNDPSSSYQRNLAKKYADSDRLGLFAANNIIIGSPFPPDTLHSSGADATETDLSRYPGGYNTDASYISSHILSKFEGELVKDQLGFVLDAKLVDGRKCFLRPWDSVSTCASISEGSIYKGKRKFDTSTNRGRYAENRSPGISEAYINLFYPTNVDDGKSYDWITPTGYLRSTSSVSDLGRLVQGPNRPLTRTKSSYLRMPGTNPYDPSTWNVNQLAGDIVAKYELEHGYYGVRPAVGIRSRIREFFELCKQVGVGTPGDPYRPHLGIEGRDAGNTATIWVDTTKADGTKEKVYNLVCDFMYYDSPGKIPQAGGATLGAHISYYGPAPVGTQYMVVCSDFISIPGVGPDAKAPTCLAPPLTPRRESDVTENIGYGNPKLFGNSDVRLRLINGWWTPVGGGYPSLYGASKFWNPGNRSSGTMNRAWTANQIEVVESLLVANHFVAIIDQTTSSRQLRIHGPVVAKDIQGRLINLIGSQVNLSGAPAGVVQNDMMPWNQDGDIEILPSIIIKHDPRFQYTVDFIYHNYAKSDFGR
jgi:hypothetical protein